MTRPITNPLIGITGGVLLLLTTSCLGGQTGQPESVTCEPIDPTFVSAWHGVTIQELGQAFEGKHSAALHWFAGTSISAQMTPVAFEDSLEITIHYDVATGTLRACSTTLDIPVRVHVATTSSAIVDDGVGTLSFGGITPPLHATFTFVGAVVSIDGTLTESTTSTAAEGSFESRSKGAPGTFATFR